MSFTRRDFVKAGGLSLALLSSPSFSLKVFEPVVKVDNPILLF